MPTDGLLHTSELVTIVGGVVAVLGMLFAAVALITTLKYRSESLEQFKIDVTQDLKQIVWKEDFYAFRDEMKTALEIMTRRLEAVENELRKRLK